MLRSTSILRSGERVSRRAAQARAGLCAVGLAVLGQIASACLADAPSEIIEEFDVNRAGDVVIVPVSIEGRSYPFVIDTGASGWIFDDALRGLLGPIIDRVTVDAGGFSIRTDLHSMPTVRLGRMAVDSSAGVACAPLRQTFVPQGLDAYGVVCTKFLRDKIVQIDFDRGKLIFVSRVPQNVGERLPLVWKDDRPYLDLDLGNAGKETFLIDTGHYSAGTGSLREAMCERLATSARLEPVRALGHAGVLTMLGTTSTRYAKIDCFRVGTFSHQGLVFHSSKKSTLGLGYLSRYLVTFDFIHSAIYLKPGRQYARKDQYDLAGIGLVRVDSKTLVDSVSSGGPADRAGVKQLDEILEVDGVAVAKLSIFELQRMLATPGERRVRYVRTASAVEQGEATLVLRDMDDEAAAAP